MYDHEDFLSDYKILHKSECIVLIDDRYVSALSENFKTQVFEWTSDIGRRWTWWTDVRSLRSYLYLFEMHSILKLIKNAYQFL